MSEACRWYLPGQKCDEERVAVLARGLGCPPRFAELLVARGFRSPQEAAAFLQPKLGGLSDPFRLPAMKEAVAALFGAMDGGGAIVLYGDYDVDGVTSLAMLSRLLSAYGAQSVRCFLPQRMDEGYGLTEEGLRRCVKTCRPTLLVALDCGTRSLREIEGLTASGVEVVVIDHHECAGELPRCAAVVNPKRPDARHPEDADLCTAGLVFKVCHAMLKSRPLPGFDLKEMLDLAALGTVADIVPLRGENRLLVRRGLRQLAGSCWPGLHALAEAARVAPPFSTSEVGFQLAPRLNAAGRLGTAEEALRLLLTDDPGEARTLALELDRRNRERQRVEEETLKAAETALGDPAERFAIVLGGPGWHPGVLGIVAARLSRRHHRPTWIIGFDEEGLGKGSGRSIEGAPLVELLEPCGHLLERYGGHAMAAGLTIRQESLEAFQTHFEAAVRARLDAGALLPMVRPECEITLGELDFGFLDHHESLQPFGAGNPQPLWVARGVSLAAPPVPMKEKHLRLTLVQQGVRHEAVFFNQLAHDLPRPPWDVAFRISPNRWQGRVRLQILVQAVRSQR